MGDWNKNITKILVLTCIAVKEAVAKITAWMIMLIEPRHFVLNTLTLALAYGKTWLSAADFDNVQYQRSLGAKE